MSSSKVSGKRKAKDSGSLRSEKKRQVEDDLDADPELSRFDLAFFFLFFLCFDLHVFVAF